MRYGCALLVVIASIACLPSAGGQAFVNFETPQVHPLDLSPGGALLAACNTADNRIEVFSLLEGDGLPRHEASIPVGLDPVSVRFRTGDEIWVVNHVSDSVSIVSLAAGGVSATIPTGDEPCDVVFAGVPQKAFVSCSQVNTVQVFDPEDPAAGPLDEIELQGEDPRALAVSADGATVYAAIFESGNRTTLLGGGSEGPDVISFPPNVVDDSGTPHGGANPPPNTDTGFQPPINPGLPAPPKVGLIVQQGEGGTWHDDSGADWTSHVSGPNAPQSGRPVGWELLDHDVAVIDANTNSVEYIDGLMNINMALSVQPGTGRITVVGTEAINQVRFEPNVRGVFVRVHLAIAEDSGVVNAIRDINPHLDYETRLIPQADRDKSLGDPRGIAWNGDGTKAYVTGMGSNNLVVLAADGTRARPLPIPVGVGPTGVVFDGVRDRVYVLNRFGGGLSVVDAAAETELGRVPFFDPTPEAIRKGRRHLYDTHATSGLGQAACGSCHVDARMDRLAWDLGGPPGDMKNLNDLNLGAGLPGLDDGFQSFHPMKGPMSTQTLQGIIGQEPFHWRGDRLGIEEFNPAFESLNGDDEVLRPEQMQEFKDFLASIYFPPNPYRGLDNSLPEDLDLPGHLTTGRFAAAGQPLPHGNAVRGLDMYRSQTRPLDRGAIACVTCHALPSGNGTDTRFDGSNMVPIPRDPITGNNHLMLVSVDGSTNRSIKVPQLRNMYDKVGFSMVTTESRSGFGFLHDGSVDTIERFVSEEAFIVANDQEVADLVALMLAFSGSDFGVTDPGPEPLEPRGAESRDVHAAVGRQVTLRDDALVPDLLPALAEIASESDRVDLIAKSIQHGFPRGWLYLGSGLYQSDMQEEVLTTNELLALAAPGAEITFTAVPEGSGTRIGLDRDLDGTYDFDELQAGTDPADPTDFPGSGGEGEGEGEGETSGLELHEVIPDTVMQFTATPVLFRGIFPVSAALSVTEAAAIYRVYIGDSPFSVAELATFRAGTEESTGDAITAYDGVQDNAMYLTTPEIEQLGGVTIQIVDLEHPGNSLTVLPDTSLLEVLQDAANIFHTADTNKDRKISLSELLRGVQFYNSGTLHCEAGTEDGFAPLAGAQDCEPHDSDYAPQDWSVNLSELMRLVQFFNSRSYHPCDEGEDGFCPGAAI